MKLSDYLEPLERGSKAAFAKKIGAYTSDLSDWIAGNRPIPARFCLSIERATGGAVTRADCRPNDWADYWPDFQVTSSAETQEA